MTTQVRALVSELLGSFILVFIGCLAILATNLTGQGDLVVISFGFGLALLAGLYAFGEVSGGHFNPAVSLGALLDKRVDITTFVQYTVAQIVGAVLAGLAILVVSSQAAVASTATVPAEAVGAGSAFMLEIILTAVFVAVILKVTTSDTMGPSAFLGIPLTLTAIHLASAPLTGTSVNPARSLGPAIVGDVYTDVWVYLTAPFIGAVIGWVLYRFVIGRMGAEAA